MSLAVQELKPKQLTPQQLEQAAIRISHSRGALDLALGEAIARLFDGDGLIRLGYARRVDWVRRADWVRRVDWVQRAGRRSTAVDVLVGAAGARGRGEVD